MKQVIFVINTATIQHDHPDADLALFAMGCVASLLAGRLSRTSVDAPGSVRVNLTHVEHRRVNIPKYGGEVIVTKISAATDFEVSPTVFYHIIQVDAESRGILSWDGKIPTQTQGILEVIVRVFLSQQVAG